MLQTRVFQPVASQRRLGPKRESVYMWVTSYEIWTELMEASGGSVHTPVFARRSPVSTASAHKRSH